METKFRQLITVISMVVGCLAVAPQALAMARSPLSAHRPNVRPHDDGGASSVGTIYFSSATYQASEDAGRFAITVDRSDDSGSETFYYGVTNKSSEAGKNFNKIGNTEGTFAPGQSSYTFYLTIDNQGINGPMRTARAYIYGGHPAPVGSPAEAIIDLLQDDPTASAAADATAPGATAINPLGYPQTPTDGDPLQYVHWFVFGEQSPAGRASRALSSTDPRLAADLEKISDAPGSGSYRFWMWNQPASTIAGTVEKYLADDEREQPNTTVALSTYSLVHGACENPSAIKGRFENWINQFAKGIGNFRVVLYLEEDSLTEVHCLSHAQLQVRLQELAYAVKTLSRDPHLLIYMDAGSPDAWLTARQAAADLRKADIAQATGFYVNATHNDWTTTDVHYGQEIAKLTGGKHFIVQTDDNGRGPLVPKDRKLDGNEDLCNPPGRGTGPLTWDTGYKYVDGFLWFNNPGNSDGPCGAGDPPMSVFWPQYAAGLVERGTDQVTGPHFRLLPSQIDM